MLQEKVYCAIRETDGKEWIDVTTCSTFMEKTYSKAKWDDGQMPSWANDNKFKRIAVLNLVEG